MDLRSIPMARIALGFGQGVALFALYQSFDHRLWPATNAYVFIPLVLLAVFLPLVALIGIGNIRAVLLGRWLGCVAVLGAALGGYVAYTYGLEPQTPEQFYSWAITSAAHMLTFTLAVGLLIGHTLVTAASAEGKRIASYRTYYDLAWKHGVQVAATVAFCIVFWLLLFLGAQLFELIHIALFKKIIQKPWFGIPATTSVAALALHVTDIRPNIIAGIRILALTLLSYLLPLLAGIVGLFLISLPFTGLEGLWATKFATGLLLAAAAALIGLINTVFQDGDQAQTAPRVLRAALALAALELTPLVLIAGYGLGLRVNAYGWTHDRIVAAACIFVAAGFAGGYAWSMARRNFLVMERVNIAMAFVVPAVLIALFSPLFDPTRISVSSQMARLKAGLITAGELDLVYLRFQGGRYGVNVLHELQAGTVLEKPEADRLTALLQMNWNQWQRAPKPSTVSVADIPVIPTGRSLPESFVAQTWNLPAAPGAFGLPSCMTVKTELCHATLIDLDGDGIEEVIFIPERLGMGAYVFKQSPEAKWGLVGLLESRINCPDMRVSIEQGQMKAIPPDQSDLEIGGHRLRMRIVEPSEKCP